MDVLRKLGLTNFQKVCSSSSTPKLVPKMFEPYIERTFKVYLKTPFLHIIRCFIHLRVEEVPRDRTDYFSPGTSDIVSFPDRIYSFVQQSFYCFFRLFYKSKLINSRECKEKRRKQANDSFSCSKPKTNQVKFR